MTGMSDASMMMVSLPSGPAEDLRVPSHELAGHCARDGVADARVDLLGHLPPERGPERFAFDVRECDADSVQRNLVDFEDSPLRVEKTDELDHGVQM